MKKLTLLTAILLITSMFTFANTNVSLGAGYGYTHGHMGVTARFQLERPILNYSLGFGLGQHPQHNLQGYAINGKVHAGIWYLGMMYGTHTVYQEQNASSGYSNATGFAITSGIELGITKSVFLTAGFGLGHSNSIDDISGLFDVGMGVKF